MSSPRRSTRSRVQINLYVQSSNSLPEFHGKTYEDHIQAWQGTSAEINDRQWRLGAIAASLETNYGEGTMKKFAQEVGELPGTVYEYLRVYSHYKTSKRFENLSWTHHLMAMQSDNPKQALKEAEKGEMSVRELKKSIVKTQLKQQIQQVKKKADEFAIDPLMEEALEMWSKLKPLVVEFSERFPQFEIYTLDFIGDVQDEINEPLSSGREFLLRQIENGVREVPDLMKATGWEEATVLALAEELVRQGEARWTEQGGKGETARGARRKILVLA